MEVKMYNLFVIKPTSKTTGSNRERCSKTKPRQSLKLSVYLKRIKRI